MAKQTVLFIVGPTASGKSRVGLQLASDLNGEIISADSMQVYRGMDIGTAKSTPEELKAIPHHLINILDCDQEFSAHEFRVLALKAIEDIVKRGKTPIVVGGTGLYIRALIQGISKQPGTTPEIREKITAAIEEKGIDWAYQKLQEKDPEIASKTTPKNKRHIGRYLEIIEQTGVIPTEWFKQKQSLEDLGYIPTLVGITSPRELLYERINQRVDEMLDKGLLKEVEVLCPENRSQTASKAVGYSEFYNALDAHKSVNSIPQEELAQIVDSIKQNTRRYAKRQGTWFKKEPNIQWFERLENTNFDEFYKQIFFYISSRLK